MISTRVRFYENLVTALGGVEVVGSPLKSELELHDLIKKGIRKKAVDEVARFFGYDHQALSQLLSIPASSLAFKERDTSFDRKTSEHLIKLATLITRGKEVFEDEGEFILWLHTRIGAFRGRKPVELMETLTGIEMVLDELGRIEHGVFS